MFDLPPDPRNATWLDAPNLWPPSPPQLCSVCGAEEDNLLMIGDEEVCERETCEDFANSIELYSQTHDLPAETIKSSPKLRDQAMIEYRNRAFIPDRPRPRKEQEIDKEN
jgi:hypothetical protein